MVNKSFGGYQPKSAFSPENQPSREQRIRKMCRKGLHSMEDGDPNVFIKASNGERTCRACKSEAAKARRQAKQDEANAAAEYDAKFANGDPSVIPMEWNDDDYELAPLPLIVAKLQYQNKELIRLEAGGDNDAVAVKKEQIKWTVEWMSKRMGEAPIHPDFDKMQQELTDNNTNPANDAGATGLTPKEREDAETV